MKQLCTAVFWVCIAIIGMFLISYAVFLWMV
jgi:hypothetical protein